MRRSYPGMAVSTKPRLVGVSPLKRATRGRSIPATEICMPIVSSVQRDPPPPLSSRSAERSPNREWRGPPPPPPPVARRARVPVDADTGFGSAFNVARTVRSLIASGAGAMHIEDQVQAKRCGHRPGKAIVTRAEMVDRVKAAVDARTDPEFVIMARTDALAAEGLEAALDRVAACVEAGADMIFPEAVSDLAVYRRFAEAGPVPILANLTEVGVTPPYTVDELGDAGVRLVLYPLSAFRAMNAAALAVFETVRRERTHKRVVSAMQTRPELYDFLGYHAYQPKLDELFSREKED